MTIKNLYPTQRPALDLNFANSKRLDPRVSLTRASVGTYVGNDGLIKYAAAGEARFDHDPLTGESLGLLVEESSTNLFDYSVDVSQWTGANWTATPNSITAPDGTLTGGKVVPIVGTIFQQIGRSLTWTSGVTYSVSFFAKDAGMGAVQIQCFSQINRGGFDLVNGTSSIVTTGLSTSITPFPNGWYKCVYIFTAGSTTTGLAGLRIPSGFTPDGVKGIYAWGFQVEALAFSSSYIPTTGSTVTRAADVASITGSNFSSWYNQSEGAIFSESRTSDSHHTIWSMGPSWQNRIQKEVVTVKGQNNFSGVSSSGNFDKIALPIATGTCPLYKNGSLYTNYNGGSTETANIFYVGRSDGRYTSGHISRLTYYSTRLSDTILQNLTL